MDLKPVFILSLPRSGSTLLQRILLGSGKCSTLGEPSLLLRFLGDGDLMTRKSVFWEELIKKALRDMRTAWSGFDDAYYAGVRELMLSIYKGLSSEKEWFIDKTPRYTLIAEEIIKVFPAAKFIVLWRHPLAVANSMWSVENKGFWFPDEYAIDLYAGLLKLNQFALKYKSSICEVRYEDLVSDPRGQLKRVGEYLGWNNVEFFSDETLVPSAGGSLGDRTGVKKYSVVSVDSRDVWIKAYNNWFRRGWARRYFSGERLVSMKRHGYELPNEWGVCDPVQNLMAGLKDWVSYHRRLRKRLRYPKWERQFLRRFRRKHGYDVSFH
jgi:hypothetical protein